MEGSSLPPTDALAADTDDAEKIENFVETAMEAVRGQLAINRDDAKSITGGVDKTVEEVLDHDNIQNVQLRAKSLENPRVTVWLSDCPTWANTAWNETVYPEGLNSYNGKVNVTFDVRPY